jgi:hypothetical protein
MALSRAKQYFKLNVIFNKARHECSFFEKSAQAQVIITIYIHQLDATLFKKLFLHTKQ